MLSRETGTPTTSAKVAWLNLDGTFLVDPHCNVGVLHHTARMPGTEYRDAWRALMADYFGGKPTP